MIRLMVLSVLGLAVAAGGPIAYYTLPELGKRVRDKWFPAETTVAAVATDPSGNPSPGSPAAASMLALEGAPVGDLAEVLRFDVSVDWILRRWPRVSTGLAELQLQGYRVPLVTGTTEADLAGSLTYYFNSRQQVQRIAFHGTTGDTRKLIMLVTSRYKFVRRLTNNPGLFVYEAASADGRPKSVLEITSAEVVKASNLYQRFTIDLSIERPAS